MPRKKMVLPTDLSLAEIQHLLIVKEQMIPLEDRKVELEKELAKIETTLADLMAGKVVRKQATKKRKKKARKKVAKKKVVKKARKKVAKKKVVKKTRTKAARQVTKRAAAKGKVTLEDVVEELIRTNGKPLAFQDILATITKKKLVATKSKNFANVLRRTLSTSVRINRVGRGIYDVT
ncbi:MAG: hypothetical protein ABIF77_02965 [bacterium]